MCKLIFNQIFFHLKETNTCQKMLFFLKLHVLDTRPNYPGTRVVKKVTNYPGIRVGTRCSTLETLPSTVLSKDLFFLPLMPDVVLKNLPKFGKINFGTAKVH